MAPWWADRRLQLLTLLCVTLLITVAHFRSTDSRSPALEVSSSLISEPVVNEESAIDVTLPPIVASPPVPVPVPVPTMSDEASDGHYNVILLITSAIQDTERRHLLRRDFLSLHSNTKPCMQANGQVYYKFVINTSNATLNDTLLFEAEQIEYGDIVTLNAPSPWHAQLQLFEWTNKLNVTYDYIIQQDVYALIDVNTYRTELQSPTVDGKSLTADEKKRMILGDFDDSNPSFFIYGNKTIHVIQANFMQLTRNETSNNFMQTLYKSQVESTRLMMLADARVHAWMNSVERIHPKNTMGITHVYLSDELQAVRNKLNFTSVVTCVPTAKDVNVALITSNLLTLDDCMKDASISTGWQKRKYASTHGYAFIARSAEFIDQNKFKHRDVSWGIVDVLQKILPLYDWVLWTDDSTLLANKDKRIEDFWVTLQGLLKADFGNTTGFFLSESPDKISTSMMLIKNTELARRMLLDVQEQQTYWNASGLVGGAMSKVLEKKEFSAVMHVWRIYDQPFLSIGRKTSESFFVSFNRTDCPKAQVQEFIQAQ
jgi:hypothetical protein